MAVRVAAVSLNVVTSAGLMEELPCLRVKGADGEYTCCNTWGLALELARQSNGLA